MRPSWQGRPHPAVLTQGVLGWQGVPLSEPAARVPPVPSLQEASRKVDRPCAPVVGLWQRLLLRLPPCPPSPSPGSGRPSPEAARREPDSCALTAQCPYCHNSKMYVLEKGGMAILHLRVGLPACFKPGRTPSSRPRATSQGCLPMPGKQTRESRGERSDNLWLPTDSALLPGTTHG